MQKTLQLFLAILLTAFICVAQEFVGTPVPANADTPERIETLKQLLASQLAILGPNATDVKLMEAVLPQFLQAYPQLRRAGAEPFIDEDVTLNTAEEKVKADALKKYPAYTQKELIAQSAKRYPLYKKGERVSIRVRTNPKKTERIDGFYNGTRGGNVIIGQSNYRLADMTGIPGNDGPDGEIAKFDVNLNREYRQEWREEYAITSAAGRADFIAQNKALYEQRQRTEDFLENEKRGYTFYVEKWLTPKELAGECANSLMNKANQIRNAKNVQTLALRTQAVASQDAMIALAAKANPIGAYPSASEILQQKGEAGVLVAQQDGTVLPKNEYETEEALQEEARQKRIQETAVSQTALASLQDEEQEQGFSYIKIVVIVIIVLLALMVLSGIVSLLKKHDEELDVSKFFEGKGKVQKDFWEEAAEDPNHFRYVAYLFSDLEAATDALLKLSFMKKDDAGNVVCRRNDIRFGTYEHQNGAVAFVGGKKLNYARWREASMIWPELPGANYFKVSAEPHVSLVLPDTSKSTNIENLGVEDVRTESGEINRVYRFRAPSKEAAIQFLETFDVNEEGLVVRMETPEESYGKDINGVFLG